MEWKERFTEDKWFEKPRRAWAFLLTITLVFLVIGILAVALGIKELINEAFSLGLPMLAQYKEMDGYVASLAFFILGGILIGIFGWFTKNNLAMRPSEVLKRIEEMGENTTTSEDKTEEAVSEEKADEPESKSDN